MQVWSSHPTHPHNVPHDTPPMHVDVVKQNLALAAHRLGEAISHAGQRGAVLRDPKLSFVLARVQKRAPWAARSTCVVCAVPLDRQAVRWHHAPAAGFLRNGFTNVAVVKGLAGFMFSGISVHVTATHNDDSVHAVTHTRLTLPDGEGVQVKYTVAAYAAVRVTLKLGVQGETLTWSLGPIPTPTRATCKPLHVANAFLGTDEHAVVKEDVDRYTVVNLQTTESRALERKCSVVRFGDLSRLALYNMCVSQVWEVEWRSMTPAFVHQKKTVDRVEGVLGKSLHVVHEADRLLVYDIATGLLKFAVPEMSTSLSAALSPDGSYFALVYPNKSSVKVVHLTSGCCNHIAIDVENFHALRVFFCPTGDLAVLGWIIDGSNVFQGVAIWDRDRAWHLIPFPQHNLYDMPTVNVIQGQTVLLFRSHAVWLH